MISFLNKRSTSATALDITKSQTITYMEMVCYLSLIECVTNQPQFSLLNERSSSAPAQEILSQNLQCYAQPSSTT